MDCKHSHVKPVRQVLRPVKFDGTKWRTYLVENGSNRFKEDNLNLTENIWYIKNTHKNKCK